MDPIPKLNLGLFLNLARINSIPLCTPTTSLSIHLRNLEKWYKWIYWQGRDRDEAIENGQVEGKGGGMNWKTETDIYIYILPRVKIDSQWQPAVLCRELSSVLCDDLGGWDRGVGGREFQEGRDICVHTADLLDCAVETDTTL